MNDQNLTTVERIFWYVQNDEMEKAATLVAIAELLEDAYHWELSFDPQ